MKQEKYELVSMETVNEILRQIDTVLRQIETALNEILQILNEIKHQPATDTACQKDTM